MCIDEEDDAAAIEAVMRKMWKQVTFDLLLLLLFIHLFDHNFSTQTNDSHTCSTGNMWNQMIALHL